MSEIILVKPKIEYAEDIIKFRQELLDAKDADAFAGCACLEDCSTVEEWLEKIASFKTDANRVPSWRTVGN